jgi:hypothetical protein
MKKLVIIICFLVIVLPRARSQDDDIELITSGSSGFSYGVKGGLVSSVFAQDFQKLETIESRTGFSVGLFGTYQFNDKMGISIEALYVQEGVNHLDPNYLYYNDGINSEGYNLFNSGNYSNMYIRRVNSNVTLHNFEFPLLFNYTLPKIGEIKPKAFIGGSFDYIYSAYAKNLLSIFSYNTNPDAAYVLSDRYSDVVTSSYTYYNVSGIIGAGLEYDAYSLDIRYKFGFVPINNLATYNLQNQYLADYTSNALMISIGVNINQLINK